MKQLTTKSKIIYGIIILAIIIAAIVVVAVGFNKDLTYKPHQTIEIYIEKEFNYKDIKQIAKEVFGNKKIVVQEVEVFKDRVAISSREITEEQKTSIIEKINEKYSLELKAEEVTIQSIPDTRIRDILKPYVLPFIIATVIIMLYILSRYYKLGVLKILLSTGITILIAEVLLFTLMAITRIPVGKFTTPLIILVYIGCIFKTTSDLEQELIKTKLEEDS